MVVWCDVMGASVVVGVVVVLVVWWLSYWWCGGVVRVVCGGVVGVRWVWWVVGWGVLTAMKSLMRHAFLIRPSSAPVVRSVAQACSEQAGHRTREIRKRGTDKGRDDENEREAKREGGRRRGRGRERTRENERGREGGERTKEGERTRERERARARERAREQRERERGSIGSAALTPQVVGCCSFSTGPTILSSFATGPHTATQAPPTTLHGQTSSKPEGTCVNINMCPHIWTCSPLNHHGPYLPPAPQRPSRVSAPGWPAAHGKVARRQP